MLVIAVSGVVLGVNVAVYTAVPLTIRAFEMYPFILDDPSVLPPMNKVCAAMLANEADEVKVNESLITPFTNALNVVPDLVTAICVHVPAVIVPMTFSLAMSQELPAELELNLNEAPLVM